jgi:hypothetical protein
MKVVHALSITFWRQRIDSIPASVLRVDESLRLKGIEFDINCPIKRTIVIRLELEVRPVNQSARLSIDQEQ